MKVSQIPSFVVVLLKVIGVGSLVAASARRGFSPWIRKIPWKRKWQPTPVCLPGKSHRQRSLVSYSPWGHKESDMTEQLSTHRHMHSSSCGWKSLTLPSCCISQNWLWNANGEFKSVILYPKAFGANIFENSELFGFQKGTKMLIPHLF